MATFPVTETSDSEESIQEVHPPLTSAANLDGTMVKRKARSSAGPKVKKKHRKVEDIAPVYEVEKVVDHKKKGKTHLYLLKWENWPSDSNTWEPISNLNGCHEALFNFLEILTSKNELVEKTYLDLQHSLSLCNREDLYNILGDYISSKGISIPVPDVERTERRLKIISKWPETERDPKVVDIVKREIFEKKLYEARQLQLDALKEWEDEMNSIIGDKFSSISVINNVDLEGPPENFIYINDYLPGKRVRIPEDPPYGCSCQPYCTSHKKKCCPIETGSIFSYDKHGKIKVPPGTPIYECNKRCRCGPECINRVVQKGRSVRLSIFRTSTGCGWGVKALENISKGSFISEYVGEVITFDEAERRGKKYDEEGQTYLFDLDFNDSNRYPFTVDAAVYGNVSHFVNHSCDPNMTVYAVWADCLDPNLPKLALFANRDIKQGEEITFDYLNQSKSKNTKSKGDTNRNGAVNYNTLGMVCKCGSKKCRKFYL